MKSFVVMVVALCIGGVTGSYFIPPNDSNIQYIGRVDKTNNELYTFDWASVQIATTFDKSSSISIQLKDSLNVGPSYWGNVIYYEVYIDEVLVLELNSTVNNVITTHTLAQNLSLAKHSLNIIRRVEPNYGVSGFVGLLLEDGGMLLPPIPRPNMRIEFMGDSITCGWGTEGIYPCSDQPEVENSERTWATVTAKAIGADYHVVSWSGQGMVRYYGCPNITCPGALPSYYNRTLGMNAGVSWNFTSWIPQAVVINLATNDYGSKPYPPTDVFVSGYTNFVLHQVIPNYGKNVTIFAACYFAGLSCENVQAAYENLVSVGVNAHYVSFENITTASPFGCDYHPNVIEQHNWAQYFIPIIKNQMGW